MLSATDDALEAATSALADIKAMLQAGQPSYVPDAEFEAKIKAATDLKSLVEALNSPQHAEELLRQLRLDGYETIHDVVQYLDENFFESHIFPRILSKYPRLTTRKLFHAIQIRKSFTRT